MLSRWRRPRIWLTRLPWSHRDHPLKGSSTAGCAAPGRRLHYRIAAGRRCHINLRFVGHHRAARRLNALRTVGRAFGPASHRAGGRHSKNNLARRHCRASAPVRVSSRRVGGRADPWQPRHARYVCGHPLDRRRHIAIGRKHLVVRIGRGRGHRIFWVGPWLLRVLTPAGAIALAAVAGAARWLVAAFTADITALSLTQPLHGITFALLHLACMRLLAANVPARFAATAQAIYGTVGVGLATAFLTLISGWLYARMGPAAFAIMSLLCLAALPPAVRLRGREQPVA